MRFIFILFFLPVIAEAQTSWTHFENISNIRDISIHGDSVWCSLDYGGQGTVACLNRKTGEVTWFSEPSKTDHNAVEHIGVDHNGVVWAGTHSHGLFRFNGAGWDNFPIMGTAGTTLNDMAIDCLNRVWITNGVGGAKGYGTFLAYFDGQQWKKAFEISLQYNITEFITVDVVDSNTLWFDASPSPQLWNYNYIQEEFNTYPTENLPATQYNVIVKDRTGTLWFGTGSGAATLEHDRWTLYTTENSGLINDFVCSIAVDSTDTKWFGTWGGLSSFDGINWKHYTVQDGLLDNEIQALEIDSENNVWIGTKTGLSCLHDTITSVNTVNNKPTVYPTLQINPNPFNPYTKISFSLLNSSSIDLSIYDITGRKVRTILSGSFGAGSHSVIWDGKDNFGKSVSSGVYISRLKSAKATLTARMLLIK